MNTIKLKKCFAVLFSVLFSVLTIPNSVFASELSEVDTRSTVIIIANVPKDFSDNIAFVLEQDSTQVRFSYALTKDNGYTGSISVVGGSTYTASVSFPSSGKYNTDLAEKYEIGGEEVELSFNVKPITYSADTEENNTTPIQNTYTNESAHGEETKNDKIYLETGLQSAESVLNVYLEKVSFIQDDKNFFSFLATYSGAMFEKYYLEADPMNTEEQWDNMKDIDRFNYYITYYMPYTKLMNYQFDSENKFMEELIAQKNILSQIENGDTVYKAIVDVWKWLYSYWRFTGTCFNFYNYYDGTNAGKPTTSETVKLTDNDNEELEELEEVDSKIKEKLDKAESKKTSNPLVTWVKENFLTCIILVAVGIAFLIVYIHNRNKNISDVTDK